MDESGPNGAQNELYSSVWAPQVNRDHVWKPWFRLIFEPFVVPIWPIFKALLGLERAKIAQYGPKMGSFHLFVHPK